MIPCEPQLLDACGLINIVAAGRVDEIAAFFGELFVVEDVAEEAPDAIASCSAFTVVALTDDESETLIELAQVDGMDAGEAATFAVAAQRSLPVVTDDRRAIRAALDYVPRVHVHRTATLLRAFVHGAAIAATDAAEMLVAIEERASFWPAVGSADAEWWRRVRHGNG